MTGSTGGVKGLPGITHYVAAEHGVVGLMRTLANELPPHFIRANTVHPTGVNTPMNANDATMQAKSAAAELVNMQNALPVTLIEPVDISNAAGTSRACRCRWTPDNRSGDHRERAFRRQHGVTPSPATIAS